MMAPSVFPAQPFQAEWPRHLDPARQKTFSKVFKVFWDAISIVIFPIGLARLFACYLRNLSYRIAVPGNVEVDTEIHSYFDLALCVARVVFNPEIFKANRDIHAEGFLAKHNGERVAIRTPDGARIDGAFIGGNTYPEKVVLVAGGNVQQWETHGWVDLLKPLGTSVLCINSRGVGKSTGSRSSEGYALDYYSAYDFLIRDKGIDPENILFVGFSMGAANGTCGAAIVQEKYPGKKISAINICSFASLQKVVYENLKLNLPRVASIIKAAMKVLGIEISVEEGWKRLRGKKCFFFNEVDNVIPFSASLAKVGDIGSRAVQMYSMPPHDRKFTPEEMRTLKQQIREILELPSDLSASVLHYFHQTLPVHVVSGDG